jgi:hypothetical protein
MQWTIEMAHTAKLDGKDNWKGYARAMLRSRLIAEGVRATYPAAIGGMLIDSEAQDMPPAAASNTPLGPKDITRESSHVTEKPSYSTEAFEANLPKWRKYIDAGKKTPADVIATIESKFTLTAEQKDAIEGKDQPATPEALVALRSKAEAAAIGDTDIAKHLGVEKLEGITVAQLEKAMAFVNDPIGSGK